MSETLTIGFYLSLSFLMESVTRNLNNGTMQKKTE